ncbi:hypothetical protein [Methylobacterium nodulans]|uniref:Uncharacterized protein n=1 Tax=Methylobacterium nodulans (strain LMG 21967 / CNCM I-2342 / ORS 2060) TaxID=460265 RepID=B8IPS1_METNO|nr:hypothetical protein [Methylobacterium nodulans]ACL56571.1 conserved hypothetical protein [Methylobacterium nodulans ORS 2060]
MDQAQLEDETVLNMLFDIALFELNQRGRRVFDSFLRDRLAALAPPEQDLAPRLAGAFFSTFRVAEWHEHAGVWLEDLLAAGRRLWLLDESLEASAPENLVIGMRLFDAGPFHAGFGIIVQPEEGMVAVCTAAVANGARLPVRSSLAAALYADHILARRVRDTDVPDILAAFVEASMLRTGPGSGASCSSAIRTRRRRTSGTCLRPQRTPSASGAHCRPAAAPSFAAWRTRHDSTV